MDLCPSQIVGLAGQWSSSQSISASIYLSSEAEQMKIPGHKRSGKRLSWTPLLTLAKLLNQKQMCRFRQLIPTPCKDRRTWRAAVSHLPGEASGDCRPPPQSRAAGLHTISGRLAISFLQGSHFHLALPSSGRNRNLFFSLSLEHLPFWTHLFSLFCSQEQLTSLMFTW